MTELTETAKPTETGEQSRGIATISPATWLWWVRRQSRSSPGAETGAGSSGSTAGSVTSVGEPSKSARCSRPVG